MPDKSNIRWYEVWLRKTELSNFQILANKRQIEVGQSKLEFIDRVVVLVKSSLKNMFDTLELVDCIAEIRNPPTATSEFVDLNFEEQSEWVGDLLSRTRLPNGTAPKVCLLDSGVTRAHSLLQQLISPEDVHAFISTWPVADSDGHGTGMAGLALYGDLAAALSHPGVIDLVHRLESVRVLPPGRQVNNPQHYGAITQDSVRIAESVSANLRRVICMAVTDRSTAYRGAPTSWSAAVDQLAFGGEGGVEPKRLIVLSAGNMHDVPSELDPSIYPDSNQLQTVHDPGQAWNALTVGAFSDRDSLSWRGWMPLAERGALHPNSTTSMTWPRTWPLKPDVVMAGGNMAHNGAGLADTFAELQLLTTSHQFRTGRQFTSFGDTSAASALAAHAAATLMAAYPRAWPETIRALIVHTASWTEQMMGEFNPTLNKENARRMLSTYGFGKVDLPRALQSATNKLTLIVQDTIQPYEYDKRPKSRHMHLHDLPWPVDVLQNLGDAKVRLRATLSYFIEPHPARKAFRERHRYASHALRFDVKGPTESLPAFQKRVNKAAREEEEDKPPSANHAGWVLGPQLRIRGSIHSDMWEGTAAELAARGMIAVYPAIGWWRMRGKDMEHLDQKARYSLLVSIETDAQDVDIYTPVENAIKLSIDV